MRWIMALIALAFLLSTFLMYERGSSPRRGPSPSGQMTDYVVADVNGRPLMRSALDQRVRQYMEQYNRRDLASTDLPHIYQAALNQYAMELQMDQEVKDKGITVSDAEAEQAMKTYADQAFPTREAFFQWLERSGIKQSDYKKNIAHQLANQQLIQSVVGNITVSEDEAVQFYDNTKDLFFRQPAGFKVNLASFASKDRDMAEKVHSLLLAGQSWSQATSDDVVDSSDVLSVTSEPMFVPDSAFNGRMAAMKDLKINDVSPVFDISSDDVAVGVKVEAVEEKTTPYNEVSGDIRTLLHQQKESQAMEAFSQGLLSRAKIVIHDDSLFPAKAPVLPVTESAPAAVSGDVSSSAPIPPEPTVSVDTKVASGD